MELSRFPKNAVIFEQMIDDRKQDHINWVNELERYMVEGGSFKLARDPHQCALGKWYDHFTTDNMSVTNLLKKIEEPHENLHKAADEAENCKKDCEKLPEGRVSSNYFKTSKKRIHASHFKTVRPDKGFIPIHDLQRNGPYHGRYSMGNNSR